MQYRCAVLDDYQNVALQFADWSRCAANVDVTVFNRSLGDNEDVAKGLADFQVVCLMRERTPFPREVIETLPNLRLLVTTGRRNATIDMEAAMDKNVLVCGTDSAAHPTAELVFAHMLEFARKVGFESARLKAGETWQSSVGRDLSGKTLGLVGLGRLGTLVASIAKAFGMKVVAWSQNLTAAKYEDVVCCARNRSLSERLRCFTEDEGRSLEVGLQEQASNRRELHRLRANVVNVAGKGGARLRQVRFKETNGSEPLTTCRNVLNDAETGTWTSVPRIKVEGNLPIAQPASGMKVA